LKLLGDWGRDRDRRLAEATGQWWRGDAVPALVPNWPEDSLGDRLFSDGPGLPKVSPEAK
jgi:hypothetical protein